MKSILTVLIVIMGATAFAKGGGTKPMTPSRFLTESVEYSVLLAQANGAILAVAADVVDTANITVVVTQAQGDKNYLCKLVDDFSNGGTVVKKDVFCAAQ